MMNKKSHRKINTPEDLDKAFEEGVPTKELFDFDKGKVVYPEKKGTDEIDPKKYPYTAAIIKEGKDS